MKKFDWEAFKKGSINVCCANRKDYDSFMLHCENKGLKWASGELPTQWAPLITKQVVIVGKMGALSYCSKQSAHRFLLDIVNFNDIDFSENADEETPNKKPLDDEFVDKLSKLQGEFTAKLFELSDEYDISKSALIKRTILGFRIFEAMERLIEE